MSVESTHQHDRSLTIAEHRGHVQELRGLVAAFKVFAKAAEHDNDADPIDWGGVQALAERAAQLVLAIEDALTLLGAKGRRAA